MGVVEDVNVPLFLGRCKVRVLGSHSKSKTDIPPEDLPWAMPIQPITSAARSGKGHSPTGLVPGGWVVGLFRDGPNQQEPMIMGSVGGIPQEETDSENGYTDPRDQQALKSDPRSGPLKGNGFHTAKYPTDGNGAILVNETEGRRYPQTAYIQESDTNRLARNEAIDQTIVELKKENQDKKVKTADFTGVSQKAGLGGSTSTEANREGAWTEPLTPYGAEYPHNHVYESESGHILEIDDTPQKERLHRYHRSGTFEEFHPNGDRVDKVVRSKYEVVMRNDHIHIDGFACKNIDKGYKIKVNADQEGNHLDIQVAASGNLNIEVTEGNLNAKVGKGDANVQVENGNMNLHVNGNFDHYVSGDYNLRVDGQLRTQSGADTIMNAGPNIHLNHPGYAGGGGGGGGGSLPPSIVSDAIDNILQRAKAVGSAAKKIINPF